LNVLVPEFCDDPSRGWGSSGFRARWEQIHDRDAEDFLRALDAGLVKHTGRGQYIAPRSHHKEQFFWSGLKTTTPRSFTISVEPIITVAVLARLHFDFGWPKTLLGTQSHDGAFDVAVYRQVDSKNEYIAGEIKKSLPELNELIKFMRYFGSNTEISDAVLRNKELNAYRKLKALRSRRVPYFWAIGPDNHSHLFKVKYFDIFKIEFEELKIQYLSYIDNLDAHSCDKIYNPGDKTSMERGTPTTIPSMTEQHRIRGSLLGGAIGDALGAPVEFMSIADIRGQFGTDGLRDFAPAYGRRGAITDDTQMTLFTAEGVMRAWVRMQRRGTCGVSGVIHRAYLRWLLTQGVRPDTFDGEIPTDGWLFDIPNLHSRRAPGNTCLSALRSARGTANPEIAKNNSKGCGGVMRVAPIGLFASAVGNDKAVFEMAADAAALTHGHPTGYLTSGFLAVAIAALVRGAPLHDALGAASKQTSTRDNVQELTQALDRAFNLAAQGRPSPEQIETLGGGWVAEEALAIAVCCALTAENFADGVLLAANHTGDSDSTAAIAGNLLGAMYGEAAIPQGWLAELELREEIARIADDLYGIGTGAITIEQASASYPGW
jgi:ADP-ribosylglycohydrolase